MEFDKLVVSFLVDEVVGGFFISVPPGHIACLYDRGRGVLRKTWGPGLHLKIPFWQVAKLFNGQILEYTIQGGLDLGNNKEALGDEPINCNTSDHQPISVEGSILFKINKNKAPDLWENIGESFVSKVIRPVSRSVISSIFSQVTLNQLTSYRNDIEKKIQKELNDSFGEKALLCEGFLLSEVKYTGRPETTKDDKKII